MAKHENRLINKCWIDQLSVNWYNPKPNSLPKENVTKLIYPFWNSFLIRPRTFHHPLIQHAEKSIFLELKTILYKTSITITTNSRSLFMLSVICSVMQLDHERSWTLWSKEVSAINSDMILFNEAIACHMAR